MTQTRFQAREYDDVSGLSDLRGERREMFTQTFAINTESRHLCPPAACSIYACALDGGVALIDRGLRGGAPVLLSAVGDGRELPRRAHRAGVSHGLSSWVSVP
eukprot:2029549-Prymnesium_polylepis.2